MTEQMKWNIRITLILILFASAVIGLSFGCEKRCAKGEIKFQGKCHTPGALYNDSGERVR